MVLAVFIPAAAAFGIGALVWSYFDHQAQQAHSRWAHAHRDMEARLAQQRRELDLVHEHLAQQARDRQRGFFARMMSYQSALDYRTLTNHHHNSVGVANHAYSLLSDARVTLDAFGRTLTQARQQRDALIAQKKRARDHGERARLQAEIDLLNQLRSEVFPQKDAVKDQRDAMLAQVRALNARTRELKLAIRDTCGARGLDWYNRLEARTQQRRLTGRC